MRVDEMAMELVERMVAELRKRASELARLLSRPGQVIVHVDPANKRDPIKIEVRVRL